MESDIRISDLRIENKYNLLQEFERIKLLAVYNKICSKARYRDISSKRFTWNLLYSVD